MPETANQSFPYAEASIASGKQRTCAVLIAMALVAFPVALENSRAGSILLGTFLFLVLPLAYIQVGWMSAQFRRMRLHVRPDGLVRESGTIRQGIPWTAITRIRMRYNRRGAVRAIELYASSKRPVVIAGFEQMPEIARLIEAGVPPNATVETKHAGVDVENPLVLFGFTIVCGIALVMLVISGNRVVFEVSGIAMQIGMGLVLLVYAPVSRQNPNFRTMEVLLAVVIIGLALFRLVADEQPHTSGTLWGGMLGPPLHAPEGMGRTGILESPRNGSPFGGELSARCADVS